MRRCAVVTLVALIGLATVTAVQAADTPRRGGILLAVIGIRRTSPLDGPPGSGSVSTTPC